MATNEIPSAAYAKVVKQAWSDPAFKRKLLAEPAAVLAAAGVPVPPGVVIKVVEDSPKVMHLVLPAAPGEEELADDQLDLVAGGVAHVAQAVATAAMIS